MSTDQRHGVEVEIDSLRNILAPTQTLRLALDVLWGNMPRDMTDPEKRPSAGRRNNHD